jgi:hypothetical protein
VRIYYTGNQGKRIGESRITLDANRKLSDVTSYVHFLTVRYPADKTMEDAIAPVVAKTSKTSKAGDGKKPEAAQKPPVASPITGGS